MLTISTADPIAMALAHDGLAEKCLDWYLCVRWIVGSDLKPCLSFAALGIQCLHHQHS